MPSHAKEYLDEYEGVEETKRKTMLAMLSAMDDAVGKILAEVRQDGLEDNTLIFFISDNGGYAPNSSRNDPFRGFKTDLLEGGIREPFFLQWKNYVPPGQIIDSPKRARPGRFVARPHGKPRDYFNRATSLCR